MKGGRKRGRKKFQIADSGPEVLGFYSFLEAIRLVVETKGTVTGASITRTVTAGSHFWQLLVEFVCTGC